MNQASQQSNNLDELISELKQLWQIQGSELDTQARSLLKAYSDNTSSCNISSDSISTEEFDIQKKVLAKTREKTEALLKQLEALEILAAKQP